MKVVGEYREVKNKLSSIALWLKEENVLTEEDYKRVLEILSKNKIKIGVAGQMKYGKSTLINALLFKKRVLPTSDTPMTATLTFIEYGDKESYTVEFFSEQEWEDIEKIARMPGEGEDQKAFREILNETKARLGPDVKNYLGRKVEVSRKDLENYVGADGKFTPITKAIYIKLPHEILKELTLVDTPGFNDPIESREREAEKFLREADALIFLLYAERALDATDKYLITEKIAQFGTGGIILVLNKYDILFEKEGALEKVEEYIKRIMNEIVNDKELGETVRKTLKEAPFVKMSSLWALLGTMPESEITEDDRWYLDKYRRDFPFLKTKEDFVKFSGLDELDEILRETVKRKKVSILVKKVKGELEGVVIGKKSELSREILNKEIEERLLSEKKEDIQIHKEKFERFKDKEFPNIIKYGEELLRIGRIIDEIKEEAKKSLKERFDAIDFGEIGMFDLGGYRDRVSREVYEAYIDVMEELNHMLEDMMKKEVIDKLEKYIDEVVDKLFDHDVVKKYTKLSPAHREDLKADLASKWHTHAIEPLEIGSPDIGKRFLFFGTSPEKVKRKALEYKEEVRRALEKEFEKAIDGYKKEVEGFIELIKETLEEQTINPINEAIERAEENLKNREDRLKQLMHELVELTERKKRLEDIHTKLNAELAKVGGM